MSRKEWGLIGVGAVCVAIVGRTSLPRDVVLAVAGVLVGAVITALFSWYFYKRAGNELGEAAATLRHYVDAVLSILEREGYEVRRDPETDRPVVRRHKDLDLRYLFGSRRGPGQDEDE